MLSETKTAGVNVPGSQEQDAHSERAADAGVGRVIAEREHPLETGATALAIDVRGVSKSFRIYAQPSDRLKQAFAWGRRQYYREFWALRHVSLQVRRGDMIGIVGRNGSGKSTLLQIVAGTLMPTDGAIVTSGRVAALLELGSGFNPEFTGRENVYMNGAILGLTKREIDQRFDAIAAFADIGEFLNQPVKTYSSGMMMRLAFAVAAHVDADVLIVDEALAVGDEGFQRKCYGWLEQYRAAGGTVLFVTHSTQTVVRLCDRAVLLDHGRVLAHGDSKQVCDVYQKLLHGSREQAERLRNALERVGGRVEQASIDARSAGDDDPASAAIDVASEDAAAIDHGNRPAAFYDEDLIRPPETAYGCGAAEILDVTTHDEHGRRANALVAGRQCELRYRVRFDDPSDGVRFGTMIKTIDGIDIAGVSSAHLGQRGARVAAGQTLTVRFRLTLNLAPGVYFVNCGVTAIVQGEEAYLHRRVDVAAIRVLPCDRREIYGLAYTDPAIEYSLVERGQAANV